MKKKRQKKGEVGRGGKKKTSQADFQFRYLRDSVIEKDGVHRLADLLFPAEGKGEIGETAADARSPQRLLDPPGGVDEVDGVVGVLLHPRRDRQDVRVEDDVIRVEVELVHQQIVGARADGHLCVGEMKFLICNFANCCFLLGVHLVAVRFIICQS